MAEVPGLVLVVPTSGWLLSAPPELVFAVGRWFDVVPDVPVEDEPADDVAVDDELVDDELVDDAGLEEVVVVSTVV
ncbi:MAG: hypothetical protein OER95_15050 [Acidimicrobiia bacterium]|nr:hypothetical protein [Acidimicrobiia bacterium]